MRVRRPELRYMLYMFVVVTLVILAAAAFTSCGKDNCAGTQQDEGCPVADTPDHLVQALECAYQGRDIDMYEQLLDDQYVFYFVVEVSESLGLDPGDAWWGKAKDVFSTRRLFADSSAQFTLEFEADGHGWEPFEVERPGSTYTGVFKRFIPHLTFRTERVGEEPITYLGDDTYVDIVAIPNAFFEGYWAILQIEEFQRCDGLLTEPSLSLSLLKAWYK